MPVRTWAICATVAGIAAGVAYLQLRSPRRTTSVGAPALHPTGSDAGYLASSVCAECHPEIARTYERTGMARSFGTAKPAGLAAMAPEGSFEHSASEQRFTISHRNGKAWLTRSLRGPNGEPEEQREAEIQYWLGSGNRARGLVHRTGKDRLILLPITYYAREGGGFWGMNPGYDRPAHAGFDRPIDYRCLSCHAGYPAIEPGADLERNAAHYPGALVEGIDCQRCHGPGRRHVEAARRAKGREAIRASVVNPTRLSLSRQMEVCFQCHLETTSVQLPGELIRFDRGIFSYRPGEPLTDWLLAYDYAKGSGHDDRIELVSSVYRLMQSACYRESGGALTCTTCHNPHDIPRGDAAARHYSQVCRKCHETVVAKLPNHNAGADCTRCHMPQRTPVDAVHVRIADHLIRKRPAPERPQRFEEQGIANSYRGKVAPYYPAEAAKDSELYLAVAQVTQQSNLREGTADLERLVTREQPEHGEFYLQLGNAWLNLGQADKARRRLEEAVRRMPGNWRPLVLLASVTSAPEQAETLLRRAATLAPKDTTPLLALGDRCLSQGKGVDAVAAYQAALRIDPESAEAHNRLGAAYLSTGDAEAAQRALREAVRLRPEVVHARTDLASLLAMTGDFPEARHHFERALRLDPSYPAAHSAYATALAERGLLGEARSHYEQALRLNAADAVSHQNLGAVLEQLGQTGGALEEYRTAIRYQPDYHEAHLALGRLYLAAGQRAAAAPHLQKASTSSDAETRQEAVSLLAR